MCRSALPRGDDDQVMEGDRRLGRARGRRVALLVASTLALLACGLAMASVAGADAITPEAGPTRNATETDTLYKIVFFIGLAVVLVVWGILFYSLVRYRAKRGVTPPQIRGNTTIEIAWTAAATGIVVVLAIVTLFLLDDIKNPLPTGPAAVAAAQGELATVDQPPPPGDKALNIKVGGQQYFWRYQYPNGAVSFHDMIVPKDTTVTLDITSNDVNHSWWIPALGGKFDAIRGYVNKTWFKATKTGVFAGQCAEFCGANHAFMTARVIVVDPLAYRAWVVRQKLLIAQSQKEVAKQRKIFQGSPGGGT
jgi:cytochrome c oxidase subunit 2